MNRIVDRIEELLGEITDKSSRPKKWYGKAIRFVIRFVLVVISLCSLLFIVLMVYSNVRHGRSGFAVTLGLICIVTGVITYWLTRREITRSKETATRP